MEEVLRNKVAESGIITIDLEKYFPKEAIAVFDLKDYLFMGLILKEKDFREALKVLDVSVYTDKHVAISCSADAVIPMWAYMLVSGLLQPVALSISHGNAREVISKLLMENIGKTNAEEFSGQRVVIKGCGDKEIPEAAYIEITRLLRPVVKSIMYGEPCSTVPVYKQPVSKRSEPSALPENHDHAHGYN